MSQVVLRKGRLRRKRGVNAAGGDEVGTPGARGILKDETEEVAHLVSPSLDAFEAVKSMGGV